MNGNVTVNRGCDPGGAVESVIQGPVFSYRMVGRTHRREAVLEETGFDLILLDRGGVPAEALDAPLASWVLARLTAEAGLGGAYADARQSNDGGAFSLDFEVTDGNDKKVADFELLGYTWCVEMIGDCEGASPREIIDDFAGLLLARPRKLGRCRFSVYDPEWRDHPEDYDPRWPAETDRNVYGWNGSRFLGSENFWNAEEIEHPWPGEDYRGYHQRVLHAYRDGPKTEQLGVMERVGLGAEDAFDEDDATDSVVAEIRAELGRFLREHEDCPVALRVYDLDGRLAQDEPVSRESAQARVESWVGEGFDAAWRRHEDSVVVKVWEYPASEPPWDAALAGEAYEPGIKP